ncbi:hypothetical protein TNCV_2239511 [Trichonephila clavipes]|nr:hypothetical protein TNCV_2239511 [Trichonephila clavipes]
MDSLVLNRLSLSDSRLWVLDVGKNNLVVWKAGKRLTVNIDQVPLYHQRESDENEIRVGNSDTMGSRYQASSFEGVRPRSNWSQNSKNSGSGEQREIKEKVTGLKKDQGEGRTSVTSKRRPLIGSSNSYLTEPNRKLKKGGKEVIGYKRLINSGSGGPERKGKKVPINQRDKRKLTSSNNSMNHYRKKARREEATMPEQGTSRYNLRPRRTEIVES